MSVRRLQMAIALAVVLGMGSTARAQWGYPGGYGGMGWGGWGGGGETVQGSVARGMGAFAAGAGQYNEQTAVANSINATTLARWNEYEYQAQKEANKNERLRRAQRQQTINTAREDVEKRLRDNPEQRDIFQGDALNLAVEDITDPRIYAKALKGAKVTIGGQTVRNIPFQYAPGGITVSIHRLTQEPPPKALMADRYAADRAAMKTVGPQIRESLKEGQIPDPALVDKALALVSALETKVATDLPKGSRDRNEADKYLKALHGLLAMLKTPAIDVLLAGAEKRPDINLGQLLEFMNAFNLRFGPATTPTQRLVYTNLWQKLDTLRDEVAPALASSAAPAPSSTAPHEFFQGMDYRDLNKKAPAPPAPPAAPAPPAPAVPPNS